MKKWKCTVCGYIHEGDEPPEKCPVCGVGAEFFKEVVEEDAAPAAASPAAAAGAPPPEAKVGGIAGLILDYHLHPITVHTPNGILPMTLLFIAAAMFLGAPGFEYAAFISLFFVLLVMPSVLITGVVVWLKRYRGATTTIFIIKIGAAMVVTTLLTIMVVWRIIDPEVLAGAGRWIYLLLGAVMVGAAGLAGHLGGTMVHAGRH
jgi:rubredoxin/uncharacterized membrane protein